MKMTKNMKNIVVVAGALGLIIVFISTLSTGTVGFQVVSGSRIYEDGEEIVWRGVGCSYLMHYPENPILGWERNMPTMKAMGLNTVRLAFAFDWDTTASADDFNFAAMDAVVKYLGDNGIKSILDLHPSQYTMFNGTENKNVNPLIIRDWVAIAEHYKNNKDVVAYELFNEPSRNYGGWDVHTGREIAQGYNEITKAIRQIDRNHIVIWQTPSYYLAPFEEITDLMLPNVVYTMHRWWTGDKVEVIYSYGVEEVARGTLHEQITWRDKFNVPLWLGEFGGPGGGNPSNPYTLSTTDAHWQICENLFRKAEEQVMGWNMWLGYATIDNYHLYAYNDLLIPSTYSQSFVRNTWNPPEINIANFIIGQTGVDDIGLYYLKMYHNNDYVAFKAGITLEVRYQNKLADGTDLWYSETHVITENTAFKVIENAEVGDWNIYINVVSVP